LTRRGVVTAAVWCAACAPQVDVVAQQRASGDDASQATDASPEADVAPDADASSMPDASPDAAPPSGAKPACDPTAATSIYVVTQMLEIARISPASGAFVSLGMPDCAQKLITSIVAAAVDVDGTIWLADVSSSIVVVDPHLTPLQCKGPLFKIASTNPPPRIAFLPPPSAAATAPLYAFASGNLVVFDSQTSVQAPIAPFDGKGLVALSGTSDGRLYALRDGPSPGQASVSFVRPGDGTVVSTLTATLPGASSTTAGTYWGGDYYVYADLTAYTVKLATGDVLGPQKVPVGSAIAVAASAPCAAPP
jgi:hypothetical protein